MLLFGILEFGRGMMVQQMLINATREGARAAVLPGSTESAVKASVVSFLTNSSVPCELSDVTVSPDPETATNNQQITVSVSIPFSSVSWIPSSYILTNLQASTSMRSERFD
jgi:Flp pilus assembly protein TadG